MRATILFSIILLVAVTAPPAHAADHLWSAAFGDGAEQVSTAVAVDPVGGVALLGHFNGSVNFGGATLACPGPSDMTFLARFGPGGVHMWSRTLGDSIAPGTGKLAVDAAGNTLVALEFRGTIDMGGGPVTGAGYRDGVIARYSAAGDLLWCRTFGGPTTMVTVKAAGVDGAGNLVVAGTYTGDIDFGGTTLQYQAFTTNMFVVKFDTGGNHVWSRRLTGGLVEITAVAGDPAGFTLVAGYHGSAFDFGGGSLDADLYDVFLVRYDPAGGHAWSRSFGDPGTYQYAFDVAADGDGNAFVTGHFKSTLDLGGGDLVSAGGWDAFLGSFTPDGTHRWSRRFGDANTQRSYSLGADASGRVTIAGHFMGGVDFGGGALVADPLDFFIAGFDAAGNALWSRRLDLYNLGMKNDTPYAIAAACNAAGDIAVTGSFQEAVDCGGGDLGSAGSWDLFVAAYGVVASGAGNLPVRGPALDVFPNPFNPRTTLSFTTHTPGPVRLTIHDVSGRVVRRLSDGRLPAGTHRVSWDGRDGRGRAVASGVYFSRLEAGGAAVTRRLVLVK